MLSNYRPWHVCVLIPARNEEALLPRCLKSLLRAQSALGYSATSDIVVVADSSSDKTAEFAARLLRARGTVRRTDIGSVGAVRRLAASLVLARYQGPLERCWLANTDADCVVPPGWLISQLQLADQGVEAVAGTVDVDSYLDHGPEVAERFRRSYLVNADGSHGHVHGANLGVRADAYLRAGGWTDLATAEDHDLWGRLLSANVVTRSTSSTKVITSGRRRGRAPHGFADALAAHNEAAG